MENFVNDFVNLMFQAICQDKYNFKYQEIYQSSKAKTNFSISVWSGAPLQHHDKQMETFK